MVMNKQVVDEVSGWLRIYDDGTVDRTWSGPPEVQFLMDPVPPYDVPRDGLTVHDIPATDHTGALRVYLPQTPDSSKKLPVLVHLHGGGYCISHATWFMYHQFYSRIALAVPAVIVSPFLPLAPEHRLPAAIDASYAALLRLRALALALGDASLAPAESELQSSADFSRVFLIGDSSGGNLVHQVAARAGEDGEDFWSPLKLAGAVPIHPGFCRARRSRSELEQKPDPFLTVEMMDKFPAYGLPEGETKDHPITCPMGEAAPPLEGLRLPPYLVAVAEPDLQFDTNMEFCEAMKRAGKETEVVINRGVGHCFYLNKIAVDNDPLVRKRAEELILAVKDFVGRH